MQYESDRTLSFWAISVASHVALAMAATQIPDSSLTMYREATIPGETIQVTTVAPQGNQVKTMAVAENEAEVKSQPAAVPAPPPAPVVEAKAASDDVVIVKKPLAKTLPAKVAKIAPTSKPTPPKATPKPVVAVPVEEQNLNEPQETEAAVLTEDPETPVEVKDEALEKEIASDTEEKSQPVDEAALAVEADKADKAAKEEKANRELEAALKKEAALAQAAKKELARESVKKVEPVGQAQTGARKATSESNMAYGVPSGVRDYRELSQSPGNVPPQYPETSRHRNEQGQVLLTYYVTEAGSVTNMKLVKSSGFASLDQSAINAISKYKFVPGQAGYASHPVMFSLKGPATAVGGELRTSSTKN